MNYVTVCIAALGIAFPLQAGAQLFRSPVFVAQPGVIASFSEGDDFDFNSRWVTAIPTFIPRLTLVAIIQWTPFADENDDGEYENVPAFVYGPVLNLINTSAFSLDIDGLFAYAPNGTGSGPPFTHQFLVEGDLFLKLGSIMNVTGHWRSLSAYGMVAYLLTGQPDAAESRDKTVLLIGLSLPLAPWGL